MCRRGTRRHGRERSHRCDRCCNTKLPTHLQPPPFAVMPAVGEPCAYAFARIHVSVHRTLRRCPCASSLSHAPEARSATISALAVLSSATRASGARLRANGSSCSGEVSTRPTRATLAVLMDRDFATARVVKPAAVHRPRIHIGRGTSSSRRGLDCTLAPRRRAVSARPSPSGSADIPGPLIAVGAKREEPYVGAAVHDRAGRRLRMGGYGMNSALSQAGPSPCTSPAERSGFWPWSPRWWVPRHVPAALALLIVTGAAWRGCPSCWAVGLARTPEREACTDGNCAARSRRPSRRPF